LEYIFSQIAREARRTNGEMTYTCKCSFFEIFNERVFDLLDAANTSDTQRTATERQSSDRLSRGSRNSSSMFQEDIAGLQVRENKARGVYVDGLNESVVTCTTDAIEVIQKGNRNRKVAETAMNRESSRSHAVYQLSLKSMNQSDPNGVRKSSLFTLVDLAGSERQSGTSAAGDRLKEANAINKSLSSLGQVVQALVDKGEGKTRHIPFRDSKLTFLLRDSLGGNSRTFLVATVSPSEEQIGESLSTLKFSERAKKITNTAIVNEDVVGNVDSMRQEITRLKQELAKSKIKSNVSSEKNNSHSPVKNGSTGNTEQSDLLANELFLASLHRFVTIHNQSERYLAKTISLRKLNEKTSQQLYAANLTIKLLRNKSKDQVGEGLKKLDEKSGKILSELEGNMLKMNEVNKWVTACGEMRREINTLQGTEDVDPSLNDLGAAMSKEPEALEALKELFIARKTRDKALGLSNGKIDSIVSRPWSEESEVKFQVLLQEKYNKVLEEKESLLIQLQELMNKSTSAPTNGESDYNSVLASQFSPEKTPAVNVLDFMAAPRRASTSRRSSVGRSSRQSIGGDVNQWSNMQESNKKIREAENKAEAISRQLHEKSLELAEANKLNAVLQREKAEIIALAGTGESVVASAESVVSDNSALMAKLEASESMMKALRDEVESLEKARFEDQQSAEESEAHLRELAQTEMDEATRQKEIAEKSVQEAAMEASLAQTAASEAMTMRVAAEEAKEAEEVALAKAKALEDDMETLSEQLEYVNAGSMEKNKEIEVLKEAAIESAREIEASKRHLETQKVAFATLQDQLNASSHEGNSAVEDLQKQLSSQAAKVASLLEDQTSLEDSLESRTNDLAKSESLVSDLRQELSEAKEACSSANEVAGDLRKEVWALREKATTLEASVAHGKAELQSVKDDRDEVTASLQEAERVAEEIREEFENEKSNYLDELERQAEATTELEEALMVEQQMMMDATSTHQKQIQELEAKWCAERDVISAKESAAVARAEQAEAEVAVLRKDTQRDVQETERELLTLKQDIKHETEKRTQLESERLVTIAKLEEQCCKTAELTLDLEKSKNSYQNLFDRTVANDVKLEAAEREAKVLKDAMSEKQTLNESLVEKLSTAQSELDDQLVELVKTQQRAARAEAEAQSTRAMEEEAYEKARDLEAKYDSKVFDLNEATARILTLEENLASNIGHSNPHQKIHQHVKLRDENVELARKNNDLIQKLKRIEHNVADVENRTPVSTKKLHTPSPLCGGGAADALPPPPSSPLIEKTNKGVISS